MRWLNHAVEKIWPVCMEPIVSQKILLPIIPWFLENYKPWTVKDAVVQHLYMGRSPLVFTEMRVLHQTTDDDHLVLELGMNFRTADDMSAILAVKLSLDWGKVPSSLAFPWPFESMLCRATIFSDDSETYFHSWASCYRTSRDCWMVG